MCSTRSELISSIVDDLIASDMVNHADYPENGLREDITELISRSLADYCIIRGEIL